MLTEQGRVPPDAGPVSGSSAPVNRAPAPGPRPGGRSPGPCPGPGRADPRRAPAGSHGSVQPVHRPRAAGATHSSVVAVASRLLQLRGQFVAVCHPVGVRDEARIGLQPRSPRVPCTVVARGARCSRRGSGTRPSSAAPGRAPTSGWPSPAAAEPHRSPSTPWTPRPTSPAPTRTAMSRRTGPRPSRARAWTAATMPKAQNMPAPRSPTGSPHFTGAPPGVPVMLMTPGHRLGDQVVPGPVGVRAGLAEAGDAGVDQPRVEPGEGLVVDAEPLRHARAEVLHHDVGRPHQPVERRQVLGRLQVEADAALVPVQGEEGAAVLAVDGIPPGPPGLVTGLAGSRS